MAEVIVLAAVVVAAALTVFTGAANEPAARHTYPATTRSGNVGGSEGVAAPGSGWTLVAGYRIPIVVTAGPFRHTDGVVDGFARTRLGAVLAAAHIAARSIAQAGSKVFGRTIDRQVFDPHGDRLARAVLADYQAARRKVPVPDGAPLPPPRPVTVAGYRVQELNPREPAGIDTLSGMHVHLLLRTASGYHQDMHAEVRWLHGDWRLYAPAHADWAAAVTTARYPHGYTSLQ